MEKFSDFISEQKNEQPYRFVIIHNEPENMTDDSRAEAEELADNFIKAGKSLGLEGFKCKLKTHIFHARVINFLFTTLMIKNFY